MRLPKMILFDYGETLAAEAPIDGLAGTRAVLRSCVDNPQNVSARDVQRFADDLNADIRRGGLDCRIELHNHVFQRYLYEYFGMTPLVSWQQMEQVFWDHAVPAEPTPNIHRLLDSIHARGIRSGVISNISFSGESLKRRIDGLLPGNRFEFVVATSEYAFRKPHRRIFEIALRKAALPPDAVWYCGNHPVKDVEGARRCGISPIWYTGAGRTSPRGPDCGCLEISNWLELIDILESLPQE